MSSNLPKIYISQSPASLHIKFALVCLNKPPLSKRFGYLCFILSHIQIFAVIIRSAYIALPDSTPSSSPIIQLFLKFFVIGGWLSSDSTVPLLAGTLIITFYTAKMLALSAYTLAYLHQKRRIHELVQSYWSLLHAAHPLMVFFWIHTFSLEIIRYSQHEDFCDAVEVFMTVMAYMNILFNGLFAVIFSSIAVKYKTKDLISSKTSLLETKNILFQIVVPIVWAIAENNKSTQIWMSTLILMSTLVNDWIFLKYLPYYRIPVLLLSACFQAVQTSLALAIFIAKLLLEDHGTFSAQMIWLLTAPVMAKAYYVATWKILSFVSGAEIHETKNVAYLIHKRAVFLYFLKSRKIIDPQVNKLAFSDIVYQARMAYLVKNSGKEFSELDRNKDLLVKTLKNFCLNILEKYPDAFLAQINLAYFYFKYEDLYLVAYNLIEHVIARGPGWSEQISLYMFQFKLQKKLMKEFSQKSSEGLDLASFMTGQGLYEQVKNSMEKQAKTQLDFWKEFLVMKPEMLKLKRIALEVKSQKKIVQELWKGLLKARSASFLAPLMVYGVYSSLINSDSIEGEKYIEQSQEDAKRLKRLLKSNELNDHTAFSENTVRVTMSGSTSDLGRILDCSANISLSYGWNSNEIKGKPVELLMSPFYQARHHKFLKAHYNTGKSEILNKMVVLPVKSSNGFIRPSWIHRKVSPFIENGISYIALLKPFRPNERMVLVRKDGRIDGMSFEFAQEMNLTGLKEALNISTLCPVFKQVNAAFNNIANNIIGIPSSELEVCKIDFSSRTRKSFNTIDRSFTHIPINKLDPLLDTERNQETQGNTSIFDTSRPLLLNDGKTFEGSHSNKSRLEIRVEKLHHNSLLAEEDSIEEIYENFTKGSILTFYPIKNGGSSIKKKHGMFGLESENDATLKPVTYNVRVSNRIYEKDVLKFVMLERVSHGDTNSVQSSDGMPATVSSKIDSREKKEEEVKVKVKNETISPTFPPQIGSNLSVLDELESNDSMARRIISRSLVKAKDHHHLKLAVHQQQQNKQEMSFSQLPRKEVGKSFDPQKRTPSPRTNIEAEPNSTSRGLLKLEKNPKEVDFHKEEKSVASSYISRGKKVENIVTQALKIDSKKKSAKNYTYSFVGFVMVMALLLGLQTIHLYVGIQEVESQIPIITTAFFRQNAMVASSSALRMWNAIIQRDYTTGDWLIDNYTWKTVLKYYLDDMNKYNTELFKLLGKLNEKVQKRFYEKNVGFYNCEDDGTKSLVIMSSTSEAFQIIIEREYSCFNIDIPWVPSDNIDNSDFIFLLDNMLNDLLIQSQSQIDQLINDLDDSNKTTTEKMIVTLAVVFVVCLIFLGISTRYLYVMASEAKFFMITIFQIKPSDCEAVKRAIQRFILALKNNRIEGFELFIDNKINGEKKKDDSQRFRSGSMGSLYQAQRRVFMKLFPNYALFICWSIVYFVIASNFIVDVDSSKTQIETALQAWGNQSLALVEMADLTLTNGTAIVKNKNFMSDFLSNMENFANVNLLTERFRDKNGDLTALQEKVIFSFPCEELLTYNTGRLASTYESCLNIAKGENSIGLADANSQFYGILKNILQMFEDSGKTKEELAQIFLIGLMASSDVANVSIGFFTILYESTYEKLKEEIDLVKKETIILAVFILIISSIGTMMTWKWVVKKIFGVQNLDRHILQIISANLILNNKHLQQYLLKHSDGGLDRIKRFL